MSKQQISKHLDEASEQLKREGHSSVDDLMQWIKDSELIEESKEAEKKVKKLFDDVKDKEHVELKKFKEVVTKLADEQRKSIDQVSSMLLTAIPKLEKALVEATSAVQEALSLKKIK